MALAGVPFETHGFTRSLELDAPSAAACAGCHREQATQWNASAHRQSLTNRVFLDGFSAEPHQRCLVCHGPLEAQLKEAWLSRGSLARGVLPAADSPIHDGITCSVCHVRDGVVLSPRPGATAYGHPVRHEGALRSSEFCGSCHEFDGHSVVDGVTVLNALPMQTTLSEWKAWGGSTSCQGCHMPSGSHQLRGPRDLTFLRASLKLEVHDGVAVLTAQNVGHRVPTGDVFRHLMLWADDEPLRRFGLELSRGVDAQGRPGAVITADTRLVPNVPVRVPLPQSARRVRLTFHFTAPTGRDRPLLTREDELLEVVSLETSSQRSAQRLERR